MADTKITLTAALASTIKAPPNWRERETLRFLRGKYKPVPWAKEAWFTEITDADPRGEGDARRDHFVHVSERDPWMLAYTPRASDGEQDRRVPIKPGRYLQKFFADRLSPEQVKHFASQVRGSGLRIEYTDKADMIRKVYQTPGVTACMSHGSSHYSCASRNGNLHPTAAYCGGDLKLAYALDPATNAIVARTLVWPERKLFSRCYGDFEAMTKALAAEGFTYGLLDGARLAPIPLRELPGYFTAPYVDHIKWAAFDKETETFRLQCRATGATHSVQHGDGIAYPIAAAPHRPAGNPGESVHQEWVRLCALEAGKPQGELDLKPPPQQNIAPPNPAVWQQRNPFDQDWGDAQRDAAGQIAAYQQALNQVQIDQMNNQQLAGQMAVAENALLRILNQ